MTDPMRVERHDLLKKIAADMYRIHKDGDRIRQDLWLIEKDFNRFIELSGILNEGRDEK